MRTHTSVRFAALTLLTSGVACSSTTARVDNTRTATAQDTTSVQNPPGYRGMERDTAAVPAKPETPVDTLLQRQGTGATHDTTTMRIERDTIRDQGRVDSAAVSPADSTVLAPPASVRALPADTMPREPTGYGQPLPHDSTSR